MRSGTAYTRRFNAQIRQVTTSFWIDTHWHWFLSFSSYFWPARITSMDTGKTAGNMWILSSDVGSKNHAPGQRSEERIPSLQASSTTSNNVVNKNVFAAIPWVEQPQPLFRAKQFPHCCQRFCCGVSSSRIIPKSGLESFKTARRCTKHSCQCISSLSITKFVWLCG